MDKQKLNSLFYYRDGILYWKDLKIQGFNKAHKEAGTINKGYKWIVSRQLPKRISVHRAIWIMHNGPIPSDRVIDHIDRNPLNNRLENLRMVTFSENSLNTEGKKTKKNKKLPKNVYEDPAWLLFDGKLRYRKQKVIKGKVYYSGGHKTPEEAAKIKFIKEENL